jgi:excisionase family DNA binding protein
MTGQPMSDHLLTAAQVAARWQVPKSHVYRLARENKIPVVRLGRYRRFRRDQVEAHELAGARGHPYDGSS